MHIVHILLLVIGLTGGPAGCGLVAPATYDTVEYRPIHQAALNGDMVRLNELAQANPQTVNAGDYDRNTPLHLAAIHGHAAASEFLLKSGANVDAQNSAGMTPLHLAVKQGFVDVVKVLLRYHADLNIKDSRGWTPMIWAEKTHHDEIMNLLKANAGP